jgi:hypothetical protein
MYKLADLADLSGFSTLSSIGGNLTLQACDTLSDFEGMTKLVDVANMTITQNAQLTDFGGLNAFNKVGGDLIITSNPQLPMMTAQDFANAITVVGNVTIN